MSPRSVRYGVRLKSVKFGLRKPAKVSLPNYYIGGVTPHFCTIFAFSSLLLYVYKPVSVCIVKYKARGQLVQPDEGGLCVFAQGPCILQYKQKPVCIRFITRGNYLFKVKQQKLNVNILFFFLTSTSSNKIICVENIFPPKVEKYISDQSSIVLHL